MSYQNAESTAPARLGRYELLGQLAVGGMAEIHLARLAGEAGFEKIVVVKRLLPELVASRAFVAMFLDEGKLVARLDHPNICEVHELGKDGAEYFLVMPYLDGIPVTDLVARPRDPDRIAQLRVATGVIAQACAGLHHAHELRDADGTAAGLVHRDVSPSNLFVTVSGLVKVLDFGIAKVRGAAETEVGTVKGKTQYMAPEQLLGEALDRRCDVFALGVVLYELATHQRLFKRASDYLAARAILEEPIPNAHDADPAIPEALSRVIARALARTPADRYPDARALAAALDEAMAPHGGVATPPQIAAAVADQHADELSAQRTRQARVLGTTATIETAPPTKPARPRTGSPEAGTADAAPDAAPDIETIAAARGPVPWRWIGIALAVATALAIVVVMWMVGSGEHRDHAVVRDAPTAADRMADNGGSDNRGSDGRGSDGRVAADNRGSDGRGSDSRVAADNRGSDDRVADNRGSDSNARGSDGHGSDNRTTNNRTTNNRTANKRTADNRTADNRTADNRTTDSRTADNRTGAGHKTDDVSTSKDASPGDGWLSIDSRPFGKVFVDDREFGVTPLVHKLIPAGRHQVRVVLKDGRAKELTVNIEAGKKAAPITMQW